MPKKRRLLCAGLLATIAMLLIVAVAAASGISLDAGDSVAWGGQGQSGVLQQTAGYDVPLGAALGLQVVDVACPGETTSSFIQGGVCPQYGSQNSQLQTTEKYLQAHRGGVKLVTMTIGANDLLACLNADGSINYLCLPGALAKLQLNMVKITAGLRQAAGPNVVMVGTTYYDPLLANWLTGTSGQLVAQASVALTGLVNTELSAAYTLAGFKVADVATAFGTYVPFTSTTTSPFGTVPVAVVDICTLTWVCTPPFFDIHPTDAGYVVYTNTILGVLKQ